MRSDLVFAAIRQVSNSFLLARNLEKTARKSHKPGTCIQDTTNDVLALFGCASPIVRADAVPNAAHISTRRSRPLVGITRQSKPLNVRAVLKSPHSLPDALLGTGKFGKDIAHHHESHRRLT